MSGHWSERLLDYRLWIFPLFHWGAATGLNNWGLPEEFRTIALLVVAIQTVLLFAIAALFLLGLTASAITRIPIRSKRENFIPWPSYIQLGICAVAIMQFGGILIPYFLAAAAATLIPMTALYWLCDDPG